MADTQIRALTGTAQTRAASLAPASWDAEAREVDVVWTTGAVVRRRDAYGAFDEELVVEEGAIDTARLDAGGPVLRDHIPSTETIVGAVVPGSVRVAGGQGTCRIRFSRRADVEGLVQDVADGILRTVSVGYRLLAVEVTEREGQPDLYRVVRWEPHEISLVPVPADAGASVRAMPGAVPPAQADAAHAATDTTATNPQSACADPQERNMSAENTPVDVAALRAEAQAAERARIGEITRRAAAAGVPDAAQALIESGATVADAALALLDAVAARQAATATATPRVEVIRDESETRAAQVADAIAYRSGLVSAPSEAAREFAGLTTAGMIRELARSAGVRGVNAMSDAALVDGFLNRTLQGAAAFGVAYGSNIDRFVQRGIASIGETYGPLQEVVELDRLEVPVEFYGLGDMPGLTKNAEGEAIDVGLITDGHTESLLIETYARRVGLTRKAMINDQVGQTLGLVQRWAARAAQLRAELVWDKAILENPTMSDGVKLFAAARGNLATGAALSFASLAAARTKLRTQQSRIGDTLNLVERFLIVGPSEQTVAEQLMGAITPAKTADVVAPVVGGLTLIVEPRFEGKGFLLAADPALTPGLKVGYLRGQRGLQSKTYDSREILGMETAVWMDVGAKVVEPRFAVYTPAPSAG